MKQVERRSTIQGRNGRRFGRGFSREELQKAGSNLNEALRFGIQVDSKRRTAHEENIDIVKAFVKERRQSKKSKVKTKSPTSI